MDVGQTLFVGFERQTRDTVRQTNYEMMRPDVASNKRVPSSMLMAQPIKHSFRQNIPAPPARLSSQQTGASNYMKGGMSMMIPAPTARFQPRQMPRNPMSMMSSAPKMGLQSVQQSSLYGASLAKRNNQRQIALKPSTGGDKTKYSRQSTVMMAEGGGTASLDSQTMVPDMNKRILMNNILLTSLAGPVGLMGGGFVMFFIPRSKGGGSGGQAALDRNGDIVTLTGWKKEHPDGSRALVQGLKGDATYLVSTQDGIKDFGINAVCTHLGCVVPWNAAENKFMCPCHGSQYDPNGKVVRGPAPLSLAIAHATVKDNDTIEFTPWTEEDFRTGQAPWWK